MTGLFDILLLAMAVYVIYAGITGRGRLYAVENLKEGMEEAFRSTMRKIYIGLGTAMLLNSATSYLTGFLYTYDANNEIVPARELGFWAFLTPDLLRILTYIFLGLTLAGVVLMVILMRKFVDKNAPRKAAAEADPRAARQAGHTLPVDAFDFDEEEPPAADAAQEDETSEA